MQAHGTSVDRVIVSGVPSEEVDDVWPLIASRIRTAFENGHSLEEVESVRKALLRQDMQLWFARKESELMATMVTRIEKCDKASVLHVVALEGTGMVEWLRELERVLRVYAAACGCKFISLHGRRGWVKTLKEYGWGESAVIMYKEL